MAKSYPKTVDAAQKLVRGYGYCLSISAHPNIVVAQVTTPVDAGGVSESVATLSELDMTDAILGVCRIFVDLIDSGYVCAHKHTSLVEERELAGMVRCHDCRRYVLLCASTLKQRY